MFFSHEPNPNPHPHTSWAGFIGWAVSYSIGGIIYGILQLDTLDRLMVFILHCLGSLSFIAGTIVALLTIQDKLRARKKEKEGPKTPSQT